MRTQITDSEILDQHAYNVKAAIYKVMPGIVTAFYAGASGSAACVDVQPAVNDVRFDPDTAERISEPWPVIPRVPISYPKGGGYVMQFPLAAWDKVTLLGYDLDPTAHRLNGKQGDPIDVARHDGAYWLALPGDVTNGGAPASSSTAGTSLVIGKDGGPPLIVISGSTIQLGSTGGDHLALASKVDAITSALKTLAQILGGSAPIVVGATGVPTPALTVPAAALASAISSVASSLVAAQ